MRERHSRKHSEDSRSITPLILYQIWIDLLRVRAFFVCGRLAEHKPDSLFVDHRNMHYINVLYNTFI